MPDLSSLDPEEFARLQERARKLAQDKSSLQLIISLINKVSAAQGLENMIETLLNNILNVLGGANIILYYRLDNEIHVADLFGRREKLGCIQDELVNRAWASGKPLEQEQAFADAQMLTPAFTRTYAWAFPLLAGSELIGVIKLENLPMGMRELYASLPTFFTYVATLLKNNLGAEALRKSEEKFRTLVNNLNTGVYRAASAQGPLLQANPALARILGFDSLEEFMALPISAFYFHPEDRQRFVEEIRQKGRVKELELTLRKKDGTPISCSISANPQFDENQQLKWVDGVVEDISARKQAKEALHFQTLMLEEEIVERQKAQGELEILNAQLEQRVQSRTLELHQKNTDLQQSYDELKRAQAQLLQQDKMASIGQLAAGVAHEINNPMGFIISNLSSLEKYVGKLSAFIEEVGQHLTDCAPAARDYFNQERQQRKIDRICADLPDLIAESREGAERVKRIVQDLKNFSRIDTADFAFSDIVGGLESTLSIAANELKYKANIIREYTRLPPVWCNMGQLNQVFLNLLLNAAHAIKTRGEIRISTRQVQNFVCIAISDTGSGIPPENVGRIFDPFFTTKEVGQGTGLGLAIAYDIVVNKHGGQIDVASELGQGATFTLSLPIKTTDLPLPQDPAEPAQKF